MLAAAGGVTAVLLAPLTVAALHLFQPLALADSLATWLAAAVAGLGAAACSVATLAMVARGLRRADVRLLLGGGALGSLAMGLSVAAVRATTDPAAFPDTALGPAGLVAGGLVAASRLLPAMPRDRRWAAGTLLLLFALLEAALAAGLFLRTAPAPAAWLLLAGAALAAFPSARGAWVGPGLVAAGLLALATGRTGTIEPIAGVLALGAGGLAMLAGMRRQQAARAGTGAVVADALRETMAEVDQLPDGEEHRLARELRGTITELLQVRRTVELQRDEILRLETQDPLTGVASRRSILDRLKLEVAEAHRYQHPVAVVLLDIDGFTALNRERGMGVGDEVLREVGLRLRLRLRAADALGRIGGDSFLLLLPHTDETGAATFADALVERLRSRPIDSYDGELTVAISIGVAFMRPGMSLDAEELLGEAEAALASARAAGGNRIAFDRRHGLLRLDGRRRRDSTR